MQSKSNEDETAFNGIDDAIIHVIKPEPMDILENCCDASNDNCNSSVLKSEPLEGVVENETLQLLPIDNDFGYGLSSAAMKDELFDVNFDDRDINMKSSWNMISLEHNYAKCDCTAQKMKVESM